MGAPSPVSLFYSYAHEDEPYRDELASHLALLRRRGLIQEWHDRRIMAGDQWANEISSALASAQIVLLLISADFIASDYCYGLEMTRALERHQEKAARVIPVIVRLVDDWQSAPFGSLQALPPDGKPVAKWEDRDEAWTYVARGIREVVESMAQRSDAARPMAAPAPPAPLAQDDGAEIRHAVENFSGRLDEAAREKGVEGDPRTVRAIGDALATIRNPRSVLWVDDHPSNTRREAGALFAMQVDVEMVRSTEEAMLRLRAGYPPIDLVITDWHRDPQLQPGVSEGVRLLREMRGAQIDIPAICYHGASDDPTAGHRHRAVQELGGIGATADPVVLLRWCVDALGRDDE